MADLKIAGLLLAGIGAAAGYKIARPNPLIGLAAGGLIGLVVGNALGKGFAQSQLNERDPAFWQERARPGIDAYREQLSPVPYNPNFLRPARYGGPQTMLGAYDPMQQFGWGLGQRMGAMNATGPRASVNANVYRDEQSFQQVSGTRMTVVAT